MVNKFRLQDGALIAIELNDKGEMDCRQCPLSTKRDYDCSMQTDGEGKCKKFMSYEAQMQDCPLVLADKVEEPKQKMPSREKVMELYEMVWGMDIPSSTVPVYKELHGCMQRIMKFIDKELLYG